MTCIRKVKSKDILQVAREKYYLLHTREPNKVNSWLLVINNPRGKQYHRFKLLKENNCQSSQEDYLSNMKAN